MNGGFEYGNARVRARRAGLLRRAQYEELVMLDTDRLLAQLSDSPYRPDLTAAAPRYAGTRALDEALRTNLTRNLRDLVSWYEGTAARQVSFVVGRWDLRNIRTILRGQYARAAPDDIRAALVPAGDLEDELLGELADQSGLRPTVDLMVAWGLPSPASARLVADGLGQFEATADLRVLETALDRAVASHRHRALVDADPDVTLILRAEIDQTNLLTALRLHAARAAGQEWDSTPAVEAFVTGGSVPESTVESLARAPDHAAAAAIVADAPVPAMFRPPLQRWTESEDLVTLGDELDEALARAAVGMFSTGDPLGAGIPLAYVWAKENEVANLRTIGAALAVGIPPELIQEELVILS